MGRRTAASEATVALGGEPETAAEVRAMAARSTPAANAFVRSLRAVAISSSESSKTGDETFLYEAATERGLG